MTYMPVRDGVDYVLDLVNKYNGKLNYLGVCEVIPKEYMLFADITIVLPVPLTWIDVKIEVTDDKTFEQKI